MLLQSDPAGVPGASLSPAQHTPYIWPTGRRCAVVFSVDVDAESPFIWLNRGQEINALGEVEQRRFGPRQGIFRILDLLESYQIKGSFYVPGLVAELHPHILPNLAMRGHEIGLHGHFHERVDQIDQSTSERYLDMALATFDRQIGLKPTGHRSPSWEMTAPLLNQLKARGVAYDSSLMGYDHPYTIDGLPEIPVQWLIDDAIYFRYTSGPRDKTHPANPNHVLESWIEEFEGIREFGGLFMITVHEWISGRGQRIRMLRRLLDYITAYGDEVWIATAEEIAAYHSTSVNAEAFSQAATTAPTQF
jgi:peptidoglycan/xylan/chitin deacetylase (PgdA/CDA1 family)